VQKNDITKPTLFVSHSKRGLFYYNDASARYRCIFPAEEIIANGGQAHAIHISQIDKVTLSDYKTIVFHRPQHSAKLKRAVKKAKTQKIETWVDFDDLLFCPELSESSAAVQSGKMSSSLAKKHAKKYLKALLLFNNIQVSTEELANALASQSCINSKRLNIKVSYNRVPERWAKQAEIIPAEERLEKKIIRYLPGTSHHKHDFAHVEIFLAELLHKNPHYHLNIIGDLEFDYESFPKGQISTTPFQPYEQLPSLINDSWIIIAPLVDNIFNRCKSGLKFWESGIFGIPVISSPLKDIERFENKGLCISNNLTVWESYIKQMEVIQTYDEASAQSIHAASTSFFKQNTRNHRYAYFKLTSILGPRWPGTLINPTSKTYSQAITELKLANQEGAIVISDELRVKASIIIKQDKPRGSSRLQRKFKKLIYSPIEFIKDSALFNKH
jgi:hypothetical protein